MILCAWSTYLFSIQYDSGSIIYPADNNGNKRAKQIPSYVLKIRQYYDNSTTIIVPPNRLLITVLFLVSNYY